MDDGDALEGRPPPEGWPVRDSFLSVTVNRAMLLVLLAGLVLSLAWALA